MPGRLKQPPKSLAPLKLPPGVARDLFAYSQAHHRAQYKEIALDALRQHLDLAMGTTEVPPRTLSAQKLPEDLALDLYAYSEAHHGAPYERIVTDALRLLIELRTTAEQQTRQRFNEIKARLGKRTETVRVIDGRGDRLS